jgi:RNA polymerase sigma-70 factor (ECF subfamily)
VLDSEERFAASTPHLHDHSLRLELLERALAELPAVCRDSFLLRKLDGLTHVQIAERLGISRSLVEKHIVNAMKHCRVRMREWDAH